MPNNSSNGIAESDNKLVSMTLTQKEAEMLEELSATYDIPVAKLARGFFRIGVGVRSLDKAGILALLEESTLK